MVNLAQLSRTGKLVCKLSEIRLEKRAVARPSHGRGGLGVVMRILSVAILSVAIAGCASVGPEPEPEPQTTRGGFGDEGGQTPPPRAPRPEPAPQAPPELGTIYFEFDDSSLRPDAKASLRASAEALKKNPNIRVEVQGNCDNRGTNEYNLALGDRRANSARRYLVDLGIKASRIDTVSYGEERPAVRGNNEVAWARNRRDDFVVR
jgi:peptidoglycan-associated lipoprotein